MWRCHCCILEPLGALWSTGDRIWTVLIQKLSLFFIAGLKRNLCWHFAIKGLWCSHVIRFGSDHSKQCYVIYVSKGRIEQQEFLGSVLLIFMSDLLTSQFTYCMFLCAVIMAQCCIIHLALQETHCPGLKWDLGNLWVLLKKLLFSLFLLRFPFLPVFLTLLIAFWAYRTSQGRENCTVQLQSLHSSIAHHLHCQGIITHRTVWKHLHLHAFQSAFVSDHQDAI